MDFIMELTKGYQMIGLILLALAGQRTFAKVCSQDPQWLTAYASYNTTVTSPNYPLDYYDNLECAWWIKIEDRFNFLYGGYVLKVIFNDFELEHDKALSLSSCPFDNLTFHDGMLESSPSLGAFCGAVHPEVIYSSGNDLYVKFRTDRNHTFRGFNISVSVVKAEEASGICDLSRGNQHNYMTLKGSSGTFFSPSYPVPYPARPDIMCIWTISVSEGKRVQLKFKDIDFGKISANKSYMYLDCMVYKFHMDAYIDVRDGEWIESTLLGSYCGNKKDVVVYSTGRNMRVVFHPIRNGVPGNRGFKAHFEAVDLYVDSELCLPGNPQNRNLRLTGSHGTFKSPLDYYPADLSCMWLITVPEGMIVELSFDRFELEPEDKIYGCQDYVQVYDGKTMEGDRKGSYCGHTIPPSLKSSSRYMFVRFRSDYKKDGTEQGFKASFRAVDQSNSVALTVGIVVGVIFVIALACGVVCLLKRRKASNRAGGDAVPLSSASHTTHSVAARHSPDPSPQVRYAPVPTNSSVAPPSYPGEENVPQYPPPGESYPWQKTSNSAPESS